MMGMGLAGGHGRAYLIGHGCSHGPSSGAGSFDLDKTHSRRRRFDRLEALEAGATVRLRVAGKTGLWEKVRAAPAGAATPGLKPIGQARKQWGELFASRRGELVELTVDEPGEWADASDAERTAAWSAFKALSQAGWRSESTSSDRDELHER